MNWFRPTAYGKLRFLQGIQPEGFSWRLEPGEGFCTPEAAMTYGWGAAEMSGNLHAFIREHVVRGWWKRRVRPVLVNSWESFYFRFTQKDLLRLARQWPGSKSTPSCFLRRPCPDRIPSGPARTPWPTPR